MALPSFEELKQKRKNDEAYINQIAIGSHVGVLSEALYNQTPNLSRNPHECHQFTWATKWTDNTNGNGSIQHVKWVLTGDYPYNLNINLMSGIITGTIWMLNDMPFLRDKYPPEKMKLSGENWEKTGRPPGTTYTFTFQCHKVYRYTPPDNGGSSSGGGNSRVTNTNNKNSKTPAPPIEPPLFRSTATMTLTVVRNWTIDNLIIAKMYMSNPPEKIHLQVPVDGKDYILRNYEYNIGTKYYGNDNFSELLAEHPGPWPGSCDYGIRDEENVKSRL